MGMYGMYTEIYYCLEVILFLKMGREDRIKEKEKLKKLRHKIIRKT